MDAGAPRPPRPDALEDLELLLRSRCGLVHLETDEEDRANTLLRHLADRLELPFFEWTRSRGLARADLAQGIYETREPAKALQHVILSRMPALYHFMAVDAETLGGSLMTALVRDVARALEGSQGALVLTGAALELPPGVRQVAVTIRLPGPDELEYRGLLAQVIRDVSARRHVEVQLTAEETTGLLRNLSGLTLLEAEKVLTKALVEDGRLTADDIRHVILAKKAIVEREGLLEYYPVESRVTEVADLRTLKDWLAKREAVVREPGRAAAFGLGFPRGVLLTGVPGCGKSLSAKAIAAAWRLPLLKLDPSNLYHKYIGESERNFRRAMKAAEEMAPVVLWIDEIEKAFASGGSSEDGGVSQRILGTFLSWMQERRGDVFVVATSNDIERLPPEFLRKGRFDEIFFVDLPDRETRAEILRVHLRSRGQDLGGFDLDALATATEGFSGAEIEELVVASLYTVFSGGGVLDQGSLIAEAGSTRPLSVTRAEYVQALREWAAERAVRAH